MLDATLEREAGDGPRVGDGGCLIESPKFLLTAPSCESPVDEATRPGCAGRDLVRSPDQASSVDGRPMSTWCSLRLDAALLDPEVECLDADIEERRRPSFWHTRTDSGLQIGDDRLD